MPYTIYDSIKDEIDFLETLIKVEVREENPLAAAICKQQKSSLSRILRRVNGGYEFSLGIDQKTGDTVIKSKKTDRKTLEEEYPSLKKAAEQYSLMQNLIDSSPEDEEKG